LNSGIAPGHRAGDVLTMEPEDWAFDYTANDAGVKYRTRPDYWLEVHDSRHQEAS